MCDSHFASRWNFWWLPCGLIVSGEFCEVRLASRFTSLASNPYDDALPPRPHLPDRGGAFKLSSD